MYELWCVQDDMFYYEAKEERIGQEDEDLFAGIGQVGRNASQDHFPQLWCPNGQYSLNGQVKGILFALPPVAT